MECLVLKRKETWLEIREEDIFLVRLQGSEKYCVWMEHVVVVDANRAVVLDCVEEVALRL